MSEHFQFTAAQANLKRVFALAKDFVSKNAMLPVLQSIMIEGKAGDQFVTLTATNLESVLRMRVAANVLCTGSFCPPFTVLRDLVNTMTTDEPVEFRVTDDLRAEITSGGRSQETNLILYLPEEYPMIPDIPVSGDIHVGEITGSILQRVANEVSPLSAADSTRPTLAGVSLKFAGAQLEAAATDGFRLARLTLATTVTLDVSIIVPSASFSALDKMISLVAQAQSIDASHVSVSMTIDNNTNRVFWQVDGGYIITNLINGTYPDYEPVIPKTDGTKATVDPKVIYERAQAAAVIANETDNQAIMIKAVKDDDAEFFRVQAKSTSVGDSDGDIAAVVEGAEVEMAVSAPFLTKSLRIFKQRPDDDVVFSMNSAVEPLALTQRKDGALLHLIMPMHLGQQ